MTGSVLEDADDGTVKRFWDGFAAAITGLKSHEPLTGRDRPACDFEVLQPASGPVGEDKRISMRIVLLGDSLVKLECGDLSTSDVSSAHAARQKTLCEPFFDSLKIRYPRASGPTAGQGAGSGPAVNYGPVPRRFDLANGMTARKTFRGPHGRSLNEAVSGFRLKNLFFTDLYRSDNDTSRKNPRGQVIVRLKANLISADYLSRSHILCRPKSETNVWPRSDLE
jgi:hypothetical protein